MAYRHRWTSDSGFRYFRVVEQLQAGNGPVYNEGERVEAVTSPLWTGLLTLADTAVPARIEHLAAALGIGAMIVGVALAGMGAARLARLDVDQPPRLLVPVGLVVIAVLWPVWVWSTGGTEIGLALAWVGGCLAAISRWAATDVEGPPADISRWSLVLFGLGWLIRPELFVASIIFVAVTVVMTTTDRRRRRRMIAAAAAAPIAYQVFRMGFYGAPVPSTTLRGLAESTGAGAGWQFVIDSAAPYFLVVPLLAIAIGIASPLVRSLAPAGQHRAVAVMIAFPAGGVAGCVAVACAGGGMLHAQVLVPSLFLVVAPFAVVACSRRHAAAVAVVGIWALMCGLALRPGATEGRLGYVEGGLTIEDRGLQRLGLEQPWLDGPGLYVSDAYGLSAVATGVAAEGVVVATTAAGTLGYALGTDARVIDVRGPVDPWLARVASGPTSAAAPWVVAAAASDPARLRPDQAFAGTLLASDATPLGQLLDVAWARAATECGEVQAIHTAATGSLTPSRVLSNIGRSLGTTATGSDLDPRQIVARDCPSLAAPLVELGERVVRTDELTSGASSGSIAVLGRCEAVFLRGDDDDELPWNPIDASTWQVAVSIDAAASAGSTTVFEIGPYDTAGRTFGSAVVETDGAGYFRVRQDLPWIGSAFGPWTSIGQNTSVTVSYLPDLATARWVLYHDFAGVGSRPMLTGRDEAVLPTVVDGRPAEGVRVAARPVAESPDCVELIDPLSAIR